MENRENHQNNCEETVIIPPAGVLEIRQHALPLNMELQRFGGQDGHSYLVFHLKDGSFSTFRLLPVEAEYAAKQCGAKEIGTAQEMWKSLWDKGPSTQRETYFLGFRAHLLAVGYIYSYADRKTELTFAKSIVYVTL